MTKAVLNESKQECGVEERRRKLSELVARYNENRNTFRAMTSISLISEEVRQLSGGKVSSRTVRVWYNEYQEKSLFKEDCRGSYARKSFLEEYGYSLRFQLYLKNERRLTVAAVTKALEAIIAKDPPPCQDGRKLFDDLRPFTQRTVHRWMLKLGCKYEKSTVSYYTDTHEAEEKWT